MKKIFLLLMLTFFFSNKSYCEQLCIGSKCFDVEIAKTIKEKHQGLMWRKHLDSDKGMLFVYKEQGVYPFWMKNTFIPLDIIWIDDKKKITAIFSNVKPCDEDYCPVINPKVKAQYVLEVNANTVSDNGFYIGQEVVFNK